ncbi:hemerythrin domain-containing protein [Phycicoccus sp. HDW14]|uniref:hemerythrin domain-containing protein n=1 Tax=Phycicoccus sp. HDW14 TaxID=2714941 RepID=UPI00140DBED0|nr:hemerythrin domain-containing protein [Phycicoccus sp. HDW14]QIM21795.1 hemerythrin domain-containing protein [Phycicoccus sp. HDW14]
MCSYCGCEAITVVGRFMAEHVEIINACGDLRRAALGADAGAVERTAAVLAGLLDPHTRAEEAGLFALLARDDEFAGHVGSLCAEHVTLDERLSRIRAGHLDEVPAFERALRDHVDREENGLFPAAAIAFAGPEWDLVASMTPPPPG